jgi:REP element-mobilizing transposase RayT
MPRKLRVEYPGAMYHVMSRGDRYENIYLDDVDRQDFLKTLAEACQKAGWQVHAYCLMRNHYHVVLETPSRVGQFQFVGLGRLVPAAHARRWAATASSIGATCL